MIMTIFIGSDGSARLVRADGSVLRSEYGCDYADYYLSSFVAENPEFLPARIAGGSGMATTLKAPPAPRETVDLDRIRPGMSTDEMQRVREEIVRVAAQTLRGI